MAGNRHFWRGAVDGDGCIGVHKVNYRWYPTLELIGAESLMGQFADYVRGLCPKWRGRVCRHKRIFQVKLIASSALVMIRELYGNGGVALPRKNKRAGAILAHPWAFDYRRPTPDDLLQLDICLRQIKTPA